MQNKGAIKTLAILFGLIFIYQLSFTVVTKVVERKADKRATRMVYPSNENGEAAAVDPMAQELIDLAMNTRGMNEDQAKLFAQDTLVTIFLKEKEKETVYNLGFKKYNYRDVKEREINLGLDLRGGMNVTLEISMRDLVNALAKGQENNEAFQEALKVASQKQVKTNGDFITLFEEAFNEINPDGSLYPIFKEGLKGAFSENDITNQSSNSEILKVVRKECDNAIDHAKEILSKRIDRFGVSQPVIQQIEGSGRFLIELPGVKDSKRVRKLLQGTAQLEFWETYKVQEVYPGLEALNNLLASNDTESLDEESEELIEEDFDNEVEDVEESNDEVIENADEESESNEGLVGKINNEEDEETPEDLSDEEALAQFRAENPLFGLFLQFAPFGPESACVGIARVEDTAAINKVLRSPDAKFIKGLKLRWTAKPEKTDNGEEYLELVALKESTKNGACALSGEYISNARQDYNQKGDPSVNLEMNRDGTKVWKDLTGRLTQPDSKACRQVAIVLDNYVYSYPVVNEEIPNGSSVISGGNMTVEEAQDLANILKAGKLPASASILGEEVVGPSLGKESVQKGMWSMIFAFILVLVYMVFFYKKAGLVADVALIVNVFFLFGVLACLGSVLTLPGIAGIVLTLGMAVDSNVIIFERIKEELQSGKGLRPAIDAGYKNAYSAIIDGNVTTLITGIVLIVLGTGPVQSFAVTLCIGIVTSLFTSIFISRVLFTDMLDNEKSISFTTSFTEKFLKDTQFDFIKFRKTAYIIALVMILISGGTLLLRPLNKGIDFTGGRNYIVRFDNDVTVDAVRNALSNVKFEGWETPEVKTYGPNGQVKITTKETIEDKMKAIDPEIDVDNEIQKILHENLHSLFKEEISFEEFSSDNSAIGVMSTQKVGKPIANQVIFKSIWAIIISLILMFAYIAIRFRKWQYGLSALAALAHDTIIMIGLYTLLYNVLPFTMEVDQAFIAAVLTIIGYSINATVVIFDRVRENTKLHPKATWRENINNAINSTLTRSFNTSGSTFVVLLAIFFLGGDSIRGFIFALLVGIFAGTFSSVFLSSPIAYNLLRGPKQEKELAEAEQKNGKKK